MEKELSKEEYLRIFNDAVKYGLSIKNHPAADHYLEGAKSEALHSQQLVEAGLRIMKELHRSHRGILKKLDVPNEDKNIFLHLLGISTENLDNH